MTPSLRRRRLLAAAVPGLLAGCLVESSEDANGSGDGTGTSAGEAGSEAEGGTGSEAEGGTGSEADRESLSEGEGPESDESDAEQADDEDPPEETGPDGSGLVVTNVDVLGVTDGGYETTVRARLTVENAGQFTYGTVLFRLDAYASRPNSIEREAVGFAEHREEYSSGDRFADGTRRFTVEIAFRSRETRARADPDWYEIEVAVRRAEPV
ncbi:hypothetical protein [Halorubrum salsamenti]|uniref:hypothetical protein n=1 Tax=Halorubrum salsamenti TaxID=2583990 RepID=UPI0011A5DF45|nr:hypothetical protein [Halorubrum salsamenti]